MTRGVFYILLVKSLFMVEPRQQKGIHCRFGMKGIIAESHFDGSRNVALSIGGLRRWILNHPNQCDAMYLLPKGHPSGMDIVIIIFLSVDLMLA